mmetsp:Transcript_555/g.1063  ORF Transcript_555/g.1063 Transcript_555/m.1063 type:complete len:224 (+) Transcript_555:586-1257(+)
MNPPSPVPSLSYTCLSFMLSLIPSSPVSPGALVSPPIDIHVYVPSFVSGSKMKGTFILISFREFSAPMKTYWEMTLSPVQTLSCHLAPPHLMSAAFHSRSTVWAVFRSYAVGPMGKTMTRRSSHSSGSSSAALRSSCLLLLPGGVSISCCSGRCSCSCCSCCCLGCDCDEVVDLASDAGSVKGGRQSISAKAPPSASSAVKNEEPTKGTVTDAFQENPFVAST